MRFISVRDLRGRPAEVWRWLSDEQDMVITSNGKPIAILSAVSEDTVEESFAAIHRARAIEAVSSTQQRSVKFGLDRMGEDEINKEISAVRKKRRSRK